LLLEGIPVSSPVK